MHFGAYRKRALARSALSAGEVRDWGTVVRTEFPKYQPVKIETIDLKILNVNVWDKRSDSGYYV